MRADLEQRLQYTPNLPTLPGVALRIIDLANEPDIDLAEVAEILTKDPALVVRILKVANSALYGRRRKCANLRQAISLLGLNATLTVALSFSLSAPLRYVKQEALDISLYWRRSVLAGVASRILGEHKGLTIVEELFLAGLLQDIGMLVLSALMPAGYGSLIASATSNERVRLGQPDYERLVKLEREVLGTDHAEVGAWLLRRWNLPDYLQWAVAGSEDPASIAVPDEFLPIVSCVAVSGLIADSWLYPDDHQAPIRAAQAAKQWLGMEAEQYYAVMQLMAADLPELSALFEIQLVDPVQIAGILAEAKEILAVRSLQVLHEAAEAKRRAEMLETRTRTLEEQNRLDPLTGVFNRGWLDGILKTEFTCATEHGWPLSIAFIDLDHFKEVNDHYGHQAGDEVLISIARLLTSHLRRNDIVARYGGEEFLIVLPGIGVDAVNGLFMRILMVLRTTDHVLSTGQALRITASVGLATHLDKGQHFDTVEDLVRAADQMVYAAKRQGRDRIVTYPG